MAAPSRNVRERVMARDGQCVACHVLAPLEFQHRRAVGMGGSQRPPTYVDGLAACSAHNARFEADLQREALLYGWKVQRWVSRPERVPVLYWEPRQWCVLTLDGSREFITADIARELMGAVYGDDRYSEWADLLKAGALDSNGNRSCDWLAVK